MSTKNMMNGLFLQKLFIIAETIYQKYTIKTETKRAHKKPPLNARTSSFSSGFAINLANADSCGGVGEKLAAIGKHVFLHENAQAPLPKAR